MLLLLGSLSIGLMTLASVEMRKVSRDQAAAEARGNARLALVQAMGQLQRTMGPDQRVSATAEILGGDVGQPQWTGVWRSTLDSGESFFTRDALDGGLRDSRWSDPAEPADRVMEWLVSGSGDPREIVSEESVSLFSQNEKSTVSVPRVPLKGGHLAWWTGDLGVRANLRTADPRHELAADPASPDDGGLFRVMASQAAEMEMMKGGVDLAKSAGRVVSADSLALVGAEPGWTRDHAFDFTTNSSGVLADVADGGLKRDLTAYFEKESAPAFAGLAGLADEDPMVAPGESDSRHDAAAPRFGLLRDWARMAVPFSGKSVDEREAESDRTAGKLGKNRALANENPVKLAGNERADLRPILVEASNFTQISCYQEEDAKVKSFQIRQLMYPRVVLWNPYNCELKADRYLVMIQGNGRQEMKTQNSNVNGLPYSPAVSEWLNFEGGRSTSFSSIGGIMSSSGYNDPYMGSYYFAIPATTFAAGECLVFTPKKAAEYDGLSAYRPGSYNLNANELSCEVAPDPGRTYYVSASDIGGGINYLPIQFWYETTKAWSTTGRLGVENQADDTRVILKRVADASSKITFEDFDKLPQVTVLSASLQYGGGRESRLEWSGNEKMPIELLDKARPRPTVIPNVRTREGIRLRWFDEHPSNLLNSGPLSGTAYLEESLLGNWNPRAAFIVRSPWENVGGTLPKSGPGGGPWFFGAYTRDLFDQAVGWDEQMPVPRGGRYHGNPFGPPQEGNDRNILFDVPRAPTGVISIGQFQHAKLSDLVWHPSYAVGNSLADPRLGTGGYGGLEHSAALASTRASAAVGGFNSSEIGWSADSQRSAGRDDWAATARDLLGGVPTSDNLVYDLSFELNRTLWDRYFLSTGSPAEKADFLEDPVAHPLPNARLHSSSSTRPTATPESLADFHQAAYHLMLDGAFNVNSTRVEAWKAMLGATREAGYGGEGNIPFPRVLAPPGAAWKSGDDTKSDEAWAGYRELTTEEIDKLATRIVAEVKRRGPFVSLADFVNRRLAGDETGRMGALQAAIESAGLNSDFTNDFPLDNSESLPNYKHPDNLPDATRLEQTLKPASKAWGAPGYLTQADLLQVLGPALAARSDTFVIRCYGDSTGSDGKVLARAWCEAVVQRTPEPLEPDESGLNSKLAGQPTDFGRRFVISSFRWLSPDEI